VRDTIERKRACFEGCRSQGATPRCVRALPAGALAAANPQTLKQPARRVAEGTLHQSRTEATSHYVHPLPDVSSCVLLFVCCCLSASALPLPVVPVAAARCSGSSDLEQSTVIQVQLAHSKQAHSTAYGHTDPMRDEWGRWMACAAGPLGQKWTLGAKGRAQFACDDTTVPI